MKNRILALFNSDPERTDNTELIEQLETLFTSTLEEKKERMLELRNVSVSRVNTPQFTHGKAIDDCIKILEE